MRELRELRAGQRGKEVKEQPHPHTLTHTHILHTKHPLRHTPTPPATLPPPERASAPATCRALFRAYIRASTSVEHTLEHPPP